LSDEEHEWPTSEPAGLVIISGDALLLDANAARLSQTDSGYLNAHKATMLFVFHSESCPESTNINTAAESMEAGTCIPQTCVHVQKKL
jgi:hypothetical protein